MKSKIYLGEEVANKDRRFGSLLSYYPSIIIDRDGNETNALFTRAQVADAKERAKRNPEDVPGNKTFWEWIFNG